MVWNAAADSFNRNVVINPAPPQPVSLLHNALQWLAQNPHNALMIVPNGFSGFVVIPSYFLFVINAVTGNRNAVHLLINYFL